MAQEIEEIKSKLNIVDLIGEYVRLQKAGNNWKACCPFHNEKTPSFSVSEDKQVWHCFGCGKGGDAFGFLMEIEGLSFREALENLAQRTGVELKKYNAINNISKEEENKIWEILEMATAFYEEQLWQSVAGKNILNYLHQRGLQDETIKEFRLGYAPDGWRNIAQFLVEKNYKNEDILRAGLIIQKEKGLGGGDSFYDRFRGRIMFPITNSAGKVIGYSARITPGGDESQAKYINTPETDIYHKSSVLYGIDKAKKMAKDMDWILLVEGNMDVIAASQAQIKNTVAVSGTALTLEQLNIIKRYTRNIKMFFDMDEAGQKAAKRSAQLAFEKELNVFIVTTQLGKDAADAVKEDPAIFTESIKKALPAMEYFIEESLRDKNRNNIEDKKRIIDELEGPINSFSSKIEREYWIRQISEKLDISEGILTDEFNRRKRESFSGLNSGDGRKINNSLREERVYDKIKDIQIQIMGFFVSDDNFWREGVVKFEEDIKKYFNNPKILEVILEGGKATNFNFEKLLDKLDNLEQKKFLRELYFKNCEKNEDFSSDKERWSAVEQYFNELKKEIKKQRNEELIKDIKEAEKNKDKEKLESLTKELMELNKI